MSNQQGLFDDKPVKKSEQIDEVEGEQGTMFSGQQVDPMETKEEKIGGKKRKVESLFDNS